MNPLLISHQTFCSPTTSIGTRPPSCFLCCNGRSPTSHPNTGRRTEINRIDNKTTLQLSLWSPPILCKLQGILLVVWGVFIFTFHFQSLVHRQNTHFVLQWFPEFIPEIMRHHIVCCRHPRLMLQRTVHFWKTDHAKMKMCVIHKLIEAIYLKKARLTLKKYDTFWQNKVHTNSQWRDFWGGGGFTLLCFGVCFYIWQVGGTLRSIQFFILNHSVNKAAYKIRPQCAEQMVKCYNAHCDAACSWLMFLLSSRNEHDNGLCVCRWSPRFTVKSRLAQMSPGGPPLNFSGDICGCSSPSSLPGSL